MSEILMLLLHTHALCMVYFIFFPSYNADTDVPLLFRAVTITDAVKHYFVMLRYNYGYWVSAYAHYVNFFL